MGCPVKNNEWKRLVKYSGDETTAYRVFNAHGGKTPSVPSITDLKKDIKFKMRIFTGLEKALLNLRVGKYNEKNNTSHSISYSELSGSTQRATLNMNFFPKSVTSVIPKTKTVAKSGDVKSVVPVDPSEVYSAGGNQYVVNGEVFPSFEDANNSLNAIQKSEDGTALFQVWETHAHDTDSALNYLIDESDWTHGKEIAKKLLFFRSNTKIDILDNDSFEREYLKYDKENGINNNNVNNVNNVVGSFLPAWDTIILRETSSEEILLHEIVHALTSKALHNLSNEHSVELTKLMNHAISEFESLGISKEVYGFKNVSEFAAEMLSNESFAEVMKKMSVPNTSKSLFQSFMDIVRDLLGISDSIYDRASELIFKVARDQEIMKSVTYRDYSPDNFEELSTGLKKLKSSLEEANRKLKHKAKISRKSSIKVENELARSISELTRKTQIDIEQGEYLHATIELFEELIRQEINFLRDDIISYRNGQETTEPINSSYLNRMKTAVDLYGAIYNDVRAVLREQYVHKELIPIANNLSELLHKFDKELEFVNDFVSDQTKAETIRIIEKEVGRENLDRPVEQMLENIQTDISQASVYFGSLKDSPDQIMRAIYKLVVSQLMETERVALYKGKDLLNLQLKMEKAGYKDIGIFHERHNGEKTGYLISQKNWGEYFATKKEAYDKLYAELSKYGIKSFEDMPSHEELEKNPELKINIENAREKHILPWRKKYERLIDGVWHKNPPLNREFIDMMKIPAVKEYYDLFSETLLESKEMLPSAYNNTEHARLLLPQIKRNTMEILKSRNNVLIGLGHRIKESVIKTDQDTDFGHDTIVEDAAGNPAKLIPIHYSMKTDDTNDLSDDMTSMATAYFEMAHKFKGMSEKLDDVIVIQRSLSEGISGQGRKFKKNKRAGSYDESNIAKALRNFMDIQMFGVRENPMEWNVPGTNKVVKVSKILDMLLDFVRKNNLFMSISAISGAAKTGFDFTSDIVSKNYVSAESVSWANKEFAKNLGSVMSNIGNRSKSGKFNLMAEYNGIFGGINEVFARMNMDVKAMRFNSSDYNYFMYTFPDVYYKGILSLSVYNDYRLVDGEFITSKQFNRKHKDSKKKWSDYAGKTLYDAYETKDGKFMVKPEYKKYVPSSLENTVKYVIEDRGAALTGQITEYDRVQAARTILGKFILLHRNWMISGIPERFKKGVRNEFTEEMEEGYYISTGKLVSRFISESGNIKQKLAVWDKLADYEKLNVRKFLADATFAIGTTVLSKLIQGLAEDEPDEYWTQFLAYTLNRIRLEQVAFFKIKEAMSIINSPTAAGNLLDTLFGMGKLLTDWDKIEYGAYEDMYRFQKALIKNSRLKNIWEMRNADAVGQKNKYLVTQIL